MQEVNLFYDRHPIKIIGLISKIIYVAGAESDCFRMLKEKFENGYEEPLQVIRLKPTSGN